MFSPMLGSCPILGLQYKQEGCTNQPVWFRTDACLGCLHAPTPVFCEKMMYLHSLIFVMTNLMPQDLLVAANTVRSHACASVSKHGLLVSDVISGQVPGMPPPTCCH